jgi:hypothetical protein
MATNEPWIEVSRIRRAGGSVLALLFVLWGASGFAAVLLQLALSRTPMPIGDSSAITAYAAVWIGGMLLFGLGAVIFNSGHVVERRAADPETAAPPDPSRPAVPPWMYQHKER